MTIPRESPTILDLVSGALYFELGQKMKGIATTSSTDTASTDESEINGDEQRYHHHRHHPPHYTDVGLFVDIGAGLGSLALPLVCVLLSHHVCLEYKE